MEDMEENIQNASWESEGPQRLQTIIESPFYHFLNFPFPLFHGALDKLIARASLPCLKSPNTSRSSFNWQ